MQCPKCEGSNLEVMEYVVTDIVDDKLNIVKNMICDTCKHEFTVVSKFKLQHISNEVIE